MTDATIKPDVSQPIPDDATLDEQVAYAHALISALCEDCAPDLLHDRAVQPAVYPRIDEGPTDD